MSEQVPVLVDMDGVLADFDREAINRIRDRLPEIALLDTRVNFYISDDYPTHSDAIRELSREQGFFASLPLVDNALFGWERMLSMGFSPRICSSPIRSNPFSKEEKLAWLDQHLAPAFGSQVVDQAIITSHKYKYDGIALIDDRPKLEHEDEATWQHIVFNQPYNRHLDKPRLFNWVDPNLGSLLRHAEYLHRSIGRRALRQN